MPEHRVATQEEWQAERDKLLVEEKKITHRGDELTKMRQELPWVTVEKEYSFDTDGGTKTLADLFDGSSQLLIYHFMFGPVYEAGCTVCTSIADNLNPNVPHLKAHDTKLMMVSRAPLDKLQAYKKRMGWDIDWASTAGSDFNRDIGFVNTEEELKPFLERGNSTGRRADVGKVRNDPRRIRGRESGPERIHARGRRRLPQLRQHLARP